MPTRHRGVLCGLLAAAILAAAGCSRGPAMGTVQGSVTIDGKPAQKGAVTFIPIDGKSPTTGGEIKEGKYTARVYVGNSKVEIRVPKVVGKTKIYDTPDSPIQEVLAEVLPARYNDNTELTFDVKPGTNPKDFDLKSK